jgi:DNA-binding NarL/FixJ family response regulator
MPSRILVVEDDLVLSRVLQEVLVIEGYNVQCVDDGNKAISMAASFSPDLVLLDITLPGRSGFDLCEIWCKQSRHAPVIIITARGQKRDKLMGLELGADDYVTKPFDLEELLARVRAVLRRASPEWPTPKASQRPRAAGSSHQRIRILCVDQHPLMLEGITALIKRQPDMTVVAATNSGEEAISLFESHRPDVTVLDLNLPTISGLDVIRELRSRDPEARIIVVTAYHGDEDISLALDAGAASYLLNDSFAEDLVGFIHQVHAGKRPLPAKVSALLAERVPDSVLSGRELQVIQLIAHGMQNKEIAEMLGITRETVKSHVKSVLFKLNVRDRTEAIAVAARRGIIHMS